LGFLKDELHTSMNHNGLTGRIGGRFGFCDKFA
jgi:hypothetical protein